MTEVETPSSTFAIPEPVDLVWTSENYHDVYGGFGVDVAAKFGAAVFKALKPGGVFIVTDHAALPGSGETAPKTLHRIDITRRGLGDPHPELGWSPCYWRFEFEANAFLHHMIRNIMGCLIAVGRGDQPPEWMAQVLAAQSRDAAAPTFSPDGLYFQGPVYEARWGLPQRTAAYDWLP